MKRRHFITLLGSAMAGWPLATCERQTEMPVIGILGFENRAWVAGFHRGLADAGYVPGQNVAIEYRWMLDPIELPRLAAELVDRKVDVIVTTGSPYAAVAAKDATPTIPIVFQIGDDPVKFGLVNSFSRPGGNVTGMYFGIDLSGKQLNLLLDFVPQETTVAYLSHPYALVSEVAKSNVLAAGRALGREIIVSEVRRLNFETAFMTLVEQRAGALMVGAFNDFVRNREKIVELAAHHKIVAMYHNRQFVIDGGLMSYGPGGPLIRFLARHYVGQILKGAKPADLPVQQPNEFEFVLNLRTAKTLGLTIPRRLLAAATELIA